MNPFPLQLEDQPAVLATLDTRDPIIHQTQNPRTITQRSHLVLPKLRNSERTPSVLPMASGIAVVLLVQAAEQTAHPSAVRAGGRVIASRRQFCVHSNR
ncbi:MAG: hypothetical protein M3P12_06000 [Gemmatimonadota bacterium]|nr:hypothetical protein [Gemmatimonadota bacterium]